MGLFDSWADILSAATPWSEAEAEAVKGGSSEESTPADGGDAGKVEVRI